MDILILIDCTNDEVNFVAGEVVHEGVVSSAFGPDIVTHFLLKGVLAYCLLEVSDDVG